MVETIAPVVHGRRSRYLVAVMIHALFAGLAGALFGGLLAFVGNLLGFPWGEAGMFAICGVALLYALRELFGLPVPLFDRKKQVPDWWRTFYSAPIAAGLYGVGLGIGFLTFLRYGTYVAVCTLAFASGDPLLGIALGATFGIARGLTTLAATKTIDEEGAALVVVKLEELAETRGPRIANGLVCAALAVVAVASTACASGSTAAPGSAGDPPRTYGRPTVVGTIQDPEITESSGLAASRTRPGYLWTHNDSGGDQAIYCLTEKARSCGTWELRGAEAFDWEDMAAGPGPRPGVSYLYVGDIGDNIGRRDSIVVYRVREPDPNADLDGEGGGTLRSRALVLEYPDGPHDAEALLVHPTTGDLYIVTKKSSGLAGVYRAAAPHTGSAKLERIARIDVPGVFGGVTGGDISPDGRRLALSTYTGAVELALGDGEPFDRIWAAEPREVDIGARAQGEAVAFSVDGAGLIASSEGADSPLFLIRSDPD